MKLGQNFVVYLSFESPPPLKGATKYSQQKLCNTKKYYIHYYINMKNLTNIPPPHRHPPLPHPTDYL